MCAQFMLRAKYKQLEVRFGIKEDLDEWKDFDVQNSGLRILPYNPSPAILNDSGKRVLRMMQFSLTPAWSKERRMKFATHNARLDGVDQKPTWKRIFVRRRCLIPLTHFYEPIYTGEFAGHMVTFFPREAGQPKQSELMAAAGLWDEWINPETREKLRSFTIITDDPPAFIEKIGHDRAPIFLDESAFDEWLSEDEASPESLKALLRAHRAAIEWQVEKDRPMKAGWEKRIPKTSPTT
jgi:putative SOS response-associated peptidase YedK